MRKKYFFAIIIVAFTMIFSVYGQENKTGVTRIKKTNKDVLATMNHDTLMKSKIKEYATFVLTTDIKKLSENEKKVVALLIDVAKIMDDIYWMQTWGNQNTLLAKIHNDNDRKFVMINYGPWDRLDNNKPFLGENYKKPLDAEGKIVPVRKPSQLEVADNVVENAEPIVSESVIENTDTAIALNSEKPLGANFYPKDMTKEEFAMYGNVNKTSPYTILRRNDNGVLQTIWYHQAYKEQLTKAADILRRAADLTTDKEFANYLKLRADALLTSKYQASDMAWMDMKKNHLDLVVGPIENYEDALFEYKTAFESFVLVKDMDWSLKLDKFIGQLPELQKVLPVSDPYKQEVPGTSSDLGVYDAVYYAGDCNAGSKTIAINLPNDETVQLAKGSRRIQLKNAMRAKFDNIMVPIANRLIDQSQIKNVKFEAFFNNVMFHEVAHGLGIKNTINGKGTVRESFKDIYSAYEEAKADVLGLFMVTKLIEKGEVTDVTVEDCYVTFLAGIFRSVRFGASNAHGKANMMCFNFFEKSQAFKRTERGTYIVNYENMKTAVKKWAETILVFQGNGDYEGALKYLNENAVVNPLLQKELDRLKSYNIPVDLIFKQGTKELGI